MKIGYFILRDGLRNDERMLSLLKDLKQATFEVYEIRTQSDRDFFMSATAAQEYGVVDQVLPPNEAKR